LEFDIVGKYIQRITKGYLWVKLFGLQTKNIIRLCTEW
jgi:hypothetical protein